jgi:hypothetical protein
MKPSPINKHHLEGIYIQRQSRIFGGTIIIHNQSCMSIERIIFVFFGNKRVAMGISTRRRQTNQRSPMIEVDSRQLRLQLSIGDIWLESVHGQVAIRDRVGRSG